MGTMLMGCVEAVIKLEGAYKAPHSLHHRFTVELHIALEHFIY